MTGKFLRHEKISVLSGMLKKKKRAATENFLEELLFLLQFQLQAVTKITCAFENLLGDFWSKKCSGLFILTCMVCLKPAQGKWSDLGLPVVSPIEPSAFEFRSGPEQPQKVASTVP